MFIPILSNPWAVVEARASSIGSAVSGTAFVFFGRLADAMVGLLFSIIGARLMGKDLYGYVGATIGIVSIMALLADMGVPDATTRYVSRYLAIKRPDRIRAVIFNTLLLEAVFGAVMAILCFGLADTLANSVFHKPSLAIYLRIAAPLALMMPLIFTFSALFQGYQRQEFYTLATFMSSLTRLGSASVLLSIHPSVESALLGYLIGAVVSSTVFAVLILVKIMPGLGKRTAPRWLELKEMMGYSLPIVLTASLVALFDWIGTLFLTAFARPEEISWFNIAYGMVGIPVVLSTSIGIAYFPIVSDLHSRGKHDLLSESYTRAIKFTSLVTVPVVLILMAVGLPLIYVFYGPTYLPSIGPFIILSFCGLLRPIAAVANAVSNGVGKPSLNTKANLIGLGLSIVLCAIFVPEVRPYPFSLIPLRGLMGAAWAITISYLVGMLLQIYFSTAVTRTRLNIDAWCKAFMASTVSALLVFTVVRELAFRDLLHGFFQNLAIAGLLGLLGLGIYMIIIRFMRILDSSDMKIIEAMPLPMKKTVLKVLRLVAK